MTDFEPAAFKITPDGDGYWNVVDLRSEEIVCANENAPEDEFFNAGVDVLGLTKAQSRILFGWFRDAVDGKAPEPVPPAESYDPPAEPVPPAESYDSPTDLSACPIHYVDEDEQTAWVDRVFALMGTRRGELETADRAISGLVATCEDLAWEIVGGKGKRRVDLGVHDVPNLLLMAPPWVAQSFALLREHEPGIYDSTLAVIRDTQVLAADGLGNVIYSGRYHSKTKLVRVDRSKLRDFLTAINRAAVEFGLAHAQGDDSELAFLVQSDGAEFFHDASDHAYITFPVNGHHETWPVDADRVGVWLRDVWVNAHNAVPPKAQIRKVQALAEAKGRLNGPQRDVFLRVARVDDEIYVDLGDRDWNVVKITAEGWEVVTDSPVRFRRTPTMRPLPMPERGGSFDDLRPFVNLASETDFTLVVGWAVGALQGTGPFMPLAVQGQPGSGKTVLCHMLRSLVDPVTDQAGASAPAGQKAWGKAVRGNYVISLDNLSGVSDNLSDALCKVATNRDASRPILLNSIDDIATRSDLLSRTATIDVPVLDTQKRRRERLILREFDTAKPQILGALYDAASRALANADTVEVVASPRMVDQAIWAAAAGLDGFAEALLANERDYNAQVIEGEPVAAATVELMADCDEWIGTATEFQSATGVRIAVNQITSKLRRLAQALRGRGIEVSTDRNHGGRRIIIRKAAA